jgi:hypothetical protein
LHAKLKRQVRVIVCLTLSRVSSEVSGLLSLSLLSSLRSRGRSMHRSLGLLSLGLLADLQNLVADPLEVVAVSRQHVRQASS